MHKGSELIDSTRVHSCICCTDKRVPCKLGDPAPLLAPPHSCLSVSKNVERHVPQICLCQLATLGRIYELDPHLTRSRAALEPAVYLPPSRKTTRCRRSDPEPPSDAAINHANVSRVVWRWLATSGPQSYILITDTSAFQICLRMHYLNSLN